MRVPISPASIAALALAWLDDTRAMIGFLTRLPVGVAPPPSARALRAAPLAGALAGGVGALALALALAVGLPALPAGVAALAAMVFVTGALHEDGLADVADGFGGGGSAQAKLDIMRDSAIGAYGAIALVLSLIARVSLTAALAASSGALAGALALVAAGAVSRSAMVHALASLDPVRADGLGHAIGTPTASTAIQAHGTAVLIAAIAVLPTLGFVALAAMIAMAALAAFAMAALARRQIGGQTGDVCGAAQQAGEIAAMTALVAFAG